MVLNYTAGAADAGRAVYSILRNEMALSAALVRRLKQSDGICVSGTVVFTNYKVSPGETVTVDISSAEPSCGSIPEDGVIDILFENEGLIAVNKPPGMLVHPSRSKNSGTLSNRVAGYLGRTENSACCHAVNRLDRDTGGIVLFAKNSYMKARAAMALSRGEKEYLAAVYGIMAEGSGTADMAIKRLEEGNMLRVTSPDGQRAITHYQTAGFIKTQAEGATLLRLRLVTGRTHQIRVHCLALGHPVLGDTLYGTAASLSLSRRLGIMTQALHALRLGFTDPVSGKDIQLTASAPEVFDIFK